MPRIAGAEVEKSRRISEILPAIPKAILAKRTRRGGMRSKPAFDKVRAALAIEAPMRIAVKAGFAAALAAPASRHTQRNPAAGGFYAFSER